MSREDKKLQKHVEAHLNREKRKEAQKRHRLERAADKPAPRARLHLHEIDLDEPEEIAPAPSRDRRTKELEGDPALTEGLVIETGPGLATVLCGNESSRYRSTPDTAIGDRVLVSAVRRRIERILPRSSALARPDPHNPRIERVIAANIDIVVHVVSLKLPPLHPGLIDRYLIAIEHSGAEPLLCINKADLQDEGDDVEQLVRPYRELGVTVVFCSAATGHGIDVLAEALAGKMCVFTGHSGVGKSSLLNALDSGLNLDTGAVSEAFFKGRHTTTSSRLFDLPNGARIIDTPGIREFGLWDIDPSSLPRFFHEFDAPATACQFSDCTHTHEPVCGVKEALAEGSIPAARYDAYRRILASLKE